MPKITETITITWHRFAEEKPEYRRDLWVIPEDATKHNYIKAVFLEDNIVYPMVDLDPIFPTKQNGKTAPPSPFRLTANNWQIFFRWTAAPCQTNCANCGTTVI